MDQVRKIVAWFKQYHFWVLSVLVVLLGLFCWWSASGAMSKQYTENTGKINSTFQSVQQVQSKPFHPNDGIKKRQTEQINLLLDDVTKLWQQLYDRQSEHVLRWPAELNAEFVSTVEKLEFGAEIEDKLREHYQNYVFRHFPSLPAIIGAQAIDEGQATTAVGPGFSRRGYSEDPGGALSASGQSEDDNDYICYWAPEDQAAVRAELEFPQLPSALRVWRTQENLWVYHALLDVIKKTNAAANATRMSNAAVRTVFSLQVGQPAAQFSRTPNRIYKRVTAEPAAEVGPEAGGPRPGPEGPEGGGFALSGEYRGGPESMTGEMSEAQEQTVLLHGRYLGPDGKPIPFGGGGGGGEAGTETVDASAPAAPLDRTVFGKEYVRLPVRMVLEMDQRHLPQLIAECAMQPLQIEVQEVRVNVADAAGAAGGSMPGRNFSESGGIGGAAMIPDLSGLQEFNPQPQIATVVIQGVIYIFNKPNKELLKPLPSSGEEGQSFASAP
jgi:hypothetical protein